MFVENEFLSVVQNSFGDIWLGVTKSVPSIVGAVVIFLVGLAVAVIIGGIVAQIVKAAKLDLALKAAKVDTVLSSAGFKLDSGAFIGALVKWFIIVVTLVASFDILGLTDVNNFLSEVVLGYLPRVIVAVLILISAAIIAEFVKKLVVGGAQAASVSAANFLGLASKWAIWIFAILVALFQLQIAGPIISTLFTGIVGALAIGFGLAFGLGGKDAASDLIEKIRKEISSKK